MRFISSERFSLGKKICDFCGWIWPNRGNTARADMAGLGSVGLT